MTEWLDISARDAIEMLRADRAVYALDSLDGDWERVRAIDDMLEKGLRVPAYRIRFVSGHVRVATGAGIFRTRGDARPA